MIYHDKQLSKTIFMKLYTIILINECLRKLNNKLVFKNILNIVNNIFRAGIIILKVFSCFGVLPMKIIGMVLF